MKKVTAVGELLWDLLPSGKVLGGAPANFAFRLKDLGVPVALVSRVGNDDLGREALELLDAHGVPTDCIQRDSVFPTGTVDVKLDSAGIPDFTINPGTAYDHMDLSSGILEEVSACSLICFGTLAQREEQSRKTIRSLLDAAKEPVKLLDINLRRKCWTKESVNESLKRADILKLNDEEAEVLGGLYEIEFSSLNSFARRMIESFGLRICLITRGADGVYGLNNDGEEVNIPGIRVEVQDTIGSGDSFTAAFVKRYLEGASLKQCCEYGNEIGALVAATKGGMTPIAP